jgi:hypothetical protein
MKFPRAIAYDVDARVHCALRAHARAHRAPTMVGTTFSLVIVTKGDYSPRWLRIPPP